MARFVRISMLAAMIVLGATGCGEDGTALAPAGQGGNLRMESHCAVPDLPAALRQTFIIVDERSIHPVQQAQAFAQHNAAIRDAVLAFSDPDFSIETGRSSPRERITLLIAPTDGSVPRQVFTGCLPALSKDDRLVLGEKESALGNVFTGGFAQRIAEDAERFRAMIAGAMIQAARAAPTEPAERPGSVLEGLSALGQVFHSTDTVPRVVLVSGAITVDVGEDIGAARRKGFEDGAKVQTSLGNAEVIVIGRGGEREAARQYLRTYLLTRGGDLLAWSPSPSGITPKPAPVSLSRFTGTAAYPKGDQVVQIRVALDPNGKLVNSWLRIVDLRERAIPLTGQAICRDNGDCDIRSDSGGFAQAWVAARGSEPQFEVDAPFAGMREWTMGIKGGALTGEVFDSAVDQIGSKAGQRSVKITAEVQQKANF